MKKIKVVIAIIKDNVGRVLISKRNKNKKLADYWELPGGKIEKNESEIQALKRELFEELNITNICANYKTILDYDYEHLSVKLIVYQVYKYDNKLISKEEQKLRWLNINDALKTRLLPTTYIIFNRIHLPDIYWITPYDISMEILQKNIISHIKKGIKIIQIRNKNINEINLQKIQNIYKNHSVKMLLNTTNFSIENPIIDSFDGIHLSSKKNI